MLLSVFAFFLTLQGCATTPLEQGNAAFERDDFEAAEAARSTPAERGDVRAQYNLAMLNEKPRPGRAADLGLAETWYRAAAERGYPPAMTRLANLRRFRGDNGWWSAQRQRDYDWQRLQNEQSDPG